VAAPSHLEGTATPPGPPTEPAVAGRRPRCCSPGTSTKPQVWCGRRDHV